MWGQVLLSPGIDAHGLRARHWKLFGFRFFLNVRIQLPFPLPSSILLRFLFKFSLLDYLSSYLFDLVYFCFNSTLLSVSVTLRYIHNIRVIIIMIKACLKDVISITIFVSVCFKLNMPCCVQRRMGWRSVNPATKTDPRTISYYIALFL